MPPKSKTAKDREAANRIAEVMYVGVASGDFNLANTYFFSRALIDGLDPNLSKHRLFKDWKIEMRV